MGPLKGFRQFIKHLLGWGLAACLAGCNLGFEESSSDDDDGGGNGNGSDTAAVYLGAGSVWRLELEDNNDFRLTIRPRPGGSLRTTVRGTLEELPSGYSQLEISSATGEDQPSSNGNLAAIQLTDEVLMVRNWLGNGRMVPLIRGGDCPRNDFSANWIQWTTPGGVAANDRNDTFFGTMRLRPDQEEVELTTAFALTEDFPQDDPADLLATGSCENGIARSGEHHTFFGESGAALIHRNVGTSQESLRLALPRASISNANLDGSYQGFWIDTSRGVADRLWYVTMECASGECTARRINDISRLNSVTGEGFRIDLDLDTLDEPEGGFVTGTSTVTLSALESYSGRISCMASDDFSGSGEKLLACVGQAPQNLAATVNGFFVARE